MRRKVERPETVTFSAEQAQLLADVFIAIAYFSEGQPAGRFISWDDVFANIYEDCQDGGLVKAVDPWFH